MISTAYCNRMGNRMGNRMVSIMARTLVYMKDDPMFCADALHIGSSGSEIAS